MARRACRSTPHAEEDVSMPLNLLWLLLCDLAIPLRDFTRNYVPVHIYPIIPARDPQDAAMIAKEQERPNVSILLFQPDPLCALSPGAPLPPTCLSSSPSQGLYNSEPCPALTEAHYCWGPRGSQHRPPAGEPRRQAALMKFSNCMHLSGGS